MQPLLRINKRITMGESDNELAQLPVLENIGHSGLLIS